MGKRKFDLSKVLSKFKIPDGESIGSYHCASIIRLDKNGMYSIKLHFGYKNRNQVCSDAIEILDCDLAHDITRELNRNSPHFKKEVNLDDIFEDEPSDPWS